MRVYLVQGGAKSRTTRIKGKIMGRITWYREACEAGICFTQQTILHSKQLN